MNFKLNTIYNSKTLRTIVFVWSVWLCIFAQNAGAQTYATATLDTNKLLLGEQATLKIAINYSASKKPQHIQWPTIGDTLSKNLEIVAKSKIDTLIPNKNKPDNVVEELTLTLTSFDSGYFYIPSFTFILNNDSTQLKHTTPLPISFSSIAVDTTQEIKDIKPPFELPFRWKEYIPKIALGLGILTALAAIAYWIIKKLRKPKPSTLIPERVLLPHEQALHDLDALLNNRDYELIAPKLYYSSLTDILRVYLTSRFNTHAMEQTSNEIMLWMQRQDIDAAQKSAIKQLLLTSDMVKFAKEIPTVPERKNHLDTVRAFILNTKPAEKINPVTENPLNPNDQTV